MYLPIIDAISTKILILSCVKVCSRKESKTSGFGYLYIYPGTNSFSMNS